MAEFFIFYYRCNIMLPKFVMSNQKLWPASEGEPELPMFSNVDEISQVFNFHFHSHGFLKPRVFELTCYPTIQRTQITASFLFVNKTSKHQTKTDLNVRNHSKTFVYMLNNFSINLGLFPTKFLYIIPLYVYVYINRD